MNIYLLDMGFKQYGDCVLITQGEQKILIDCGKPIDQSSIRLQLKKILQQNPPFHFDLLVLTHCHDDHIGSFPEMIEMGEITAGKYLLADPDLRWEKPADNDGADILNDGITESLFEEDHSSLSDNELEEFLSDIEGLVARYRRMINTLKQRNEDVRIFKGIDADNYEDLYNEFKAFGLEILGPSKKHLQITRDALLGARDGISDFFEKSQNVDSITNVVDLYRKIFSDGTVDNEAFIDAAKNSGGINDQSIVIKVKNDNFSALLAGDMQFASPDVTGIEGEMKKLLNKVFESGPYTVIKTCHHSSDNGLNEEMLDKWIEDGTEFFIHSGGLNDEDHPDEKVLKILKARKNNIKFARTDRNGLIKVGNEQNGTVTMSITKGRINNFDVNIESDAIELETIGSGKVTSTSEEENKKSTPIIRQINKNTSDRNIEINAKIPADLNKVTITIEIDGEKKKY